MISQACTQTTTTCYSPNPATNQAIHDLLALGLNPIPVAPADGGKANGKNPSYIDSQGRVQLVKHSQYRDKPATEAVLKEWFQDERTGLGTNSGEWLDIDLKRFPDVATMEHTVAPIVDAAQWVERTQSGGYRVAVAPAEKPDFQNFGIGDIAHAGEFMNGGGFVVLAPTIGEHGEYTRIKFGEPLKVSSLSDLGIRPTKATPAPVEPNPPTLTAVAPNVVTMPGVVALESVINKSLQPIIRGEHQGDRSTALKALAHEAYGWENLAREIGVPLTAADSLIQSAAIALGIQDRMDVILSKDLANRQTYSPDQQRKAGKSAAAARLRKLAVRATRKPDETGLKKLNKLALHDFVESRFDTVLDVWKNEILIDGEQFDADTHHIKLAVEYGVDAGKDSVIDVVNYIGQQNKRDDVHDYLLSLENAERLSEDEWKNIALYCLGSADEFDSVLLQRSMISAVARVFQPGCKVDECLTFQGPQGLGKSSFWAVMAGQDYFTDELGDFTGPGKKDAIQKLSSSWIVEIAELDKYTAKKEAGELKSFMTSKVDDYRPPYARQNKKVPRRNIFVGTVNPPQFLNDPTGNRRYPVIRLSKPIPLEKISQNRDKIWATAVHAYMNGERWWYDAIETAQINKRAESFEYEDPWELEIFNYLDGMPYVTTRGILETALGIETGKASNRDTARVCRILAKAGWWSGSRRRVDGKLISPWYPPKTECQTQMETAQTVDDMNAIRQQFEDREIHRAVQQMEPDQQEVWETLKQSAPAPAPEPPAADDDAPLTPDQVESFVAILTEVIEARDVASMADFINLPPDHKHQIAAALSAEQTAIAAELSTAYKNRPATVQEWAESHGGIDSAMATTTEF